MTMLTLKCEDKLENLPLFASSLASTSDIQISCGPSVFAAHKIMLVGLSPQLHHILSEMTQEETVIIIPGEEEKRLENLLKILYGVEPDCFDQRLVDLCKLLGIDISQFLCPLSAHRTQEFSRLEPLLSLDLEDEFLSFQNLESILPSRPIENRKSSVLKTRDQVEAKDEDGAPVDISDGLGDPCPVCRRPCDTQGQVEYHKLIHSDLFKEQKSQGVCALCNKKFNQSYIGQHLREVHFLDQKSKYSCKHCGRKFARKEKYEGHLSKQHGAPMRYICNICGKLFSINSDLYKHRTMVHLAKADLPCQTCGKLFKTKERLKRHEQLHSVLKPWKCDKCQKIFSRNDKLASHSKSCIDRTDATAEPTVPAIPSFYININIA